MKPTELKTKRCRICKSSFVPRNTIQPTCWNYECQVAYADKHAAKVTALREKRERQALREAKERIKTRSQRIKEVQIVFNKFIRLRDVGRPCICCGLPLESNGQMGGAYDCGHYRSVGSAPHLRFDERNAHAQRKQCNRYGSGRAVDYRIGLIARIGLAAVEDLEADQSAKHYTIDELKALKAHYKAKCRELERANG